jgi:Holliday junction DNA helicase RuvB
VIESTNVEKQRVVSPKEKEIDQGISKNILRPKELSDYVGQETIKRHLSVSIGSAKIRKNTLEHLLFYGPPGLGKTTISSIVASEMESNLRSTSGPAIDKQSDLVSILSNLEQ